jgi:hypothetical protein
MWAIGDEWPTIVIVGGCASAGSQRLLDNSQFLKVGDGRAILAVLTGMSGPTSVTTTQVYAKIMERMTGNHTRYPETLIVT